MSSDTTTRARTSEHRRDELLDAAESLFAEKGVAATAVSEITAKAGVAKGTFYLYFDSKDHLVAGLHERTVAGMMRIVQAALERIDEVDYFDLVDQVTASVIDYWIDQRALFLAIRETGETPAIAQLKAEYNQRIIAMLEAGIRLGVETGVAAVDDPQRAAQFIYYGCEGACTTALLAPGPVEREQLIAGSQDIIRRILRP